MYAIDSLVAKIHPITSQYDKKSSVIKSKYFKINDWEEAKLHKQSYIDTGVCFDYPVSKIDKMTPLGTLSDRDSERLIEFLDGR